MHPLRHALAVSAVTALTVGAVIAAPTASAADSTQTGVVNCLGKVVTKPKQITISCADANIAITRITWSAWTDDSATGSGTLVWNTCLPTTCVAGVVRRYKVSITMGGLASGPSVNVFSQVDLAFPKGGPAGLVTGRYTIDNPIH